LVISLGRCVEADHLAWSLVQLASDGVELSLNVDRQIGAFGKVLSKQPVGVLVGSSLPRVLRVTE
jgi:hypothetical protein